MYMKISLLFYLVLYNNIMNKYFFLIITTIIFFTTLFQKISTSRSTDYIYPTYEENISSYFGYRNIFGKENFHNGIDFPVPEGTPVYSTQDGFIKSCSFLNGYGMSIIVQNYDGNQVLYAHLSETFLVNVGEQVTQGEQIATVGPKYLSNGILNGLTTGPHLHFTVYNNQGRAINPLTLDLKKEVTQ